MEQHRDEHIVCASCGTSFLFSAAEAAVYAERRLAAPPKRCRTCRRARKDSRGEHESASTARAAQNQRPAPARSAGGYRGVARGDGRPRKPRYTGDVNEYRSPMQDAYSGLSPAWTVPSHYPQRPRGGAPVRDDGNYRAPSFAGDRRAPAQGRAAAQQPRAPRNRPTFSITCKSCGSEGEVPFKPVEGRDVFCQACYRARKPS
ncbi:zinc-ribbon domain containing protein [Sorangium sp. So ce1078]|uniref:zinc-ribbon domain containing protein n=1 Tax=Sorangium sp. So ce1078 TaxID=3133329 RepID=UPI003F624191